MFLERSLTGRFDGLIEYSSQINRLNGGTGMALIVIQHDRVVVEPLGFKETAWRTTASDKLVEIITDQGTDLGSLGLGTNATGAGDQRNLYVSAREFAYWGYFHLRRGFINGKQMVPSELFDLITSEQSPPLSNEDLPQYGFLWYVKGRQAALSEIGDTLRNGTYQILGVTGPLVLVIPTHDTVVVRMYNKHGNYGGPDGSQWLQYLKDFGDQVMRTVQ